MTKQMIDIFDRLISWLLATVHSSSSSTATFDPLPSSCLKRLTSDFGILNPNPSLLLSSILATQQNSSKTKKLNRDPKLDGVGLIIVSKDDDDDAADNDGTMTGEIQQMR